MSQLASLQAARGLALLAAAAMLWQAGGRLVEGWHTAPLAAYVHAAWWGKGEAPPLATVLAATPGRTDGRAWSAHAQAALSLADQTPDLAERERLLHQAEAATRHALRLSPAQASAWARLSLIAVNQQHQDLAARSLARSLALAPNGPGLAWPRVKLGLYLWDGLAPLAQAGVAADLARLWQQPPSAALPYPRQALHRYAASLNRQALVASLLRETTGMGETGR